MLLLTCYVVLIFLGGALSASIGVLVELEWGDVAGLSVFLTCYFASLWLGWLIAVRITAPKGETANTSVA